MDSRGEVTHGKLLNAMDEIVRGAGAKNKIVGTFTDMPEMARKWGNAGVQYHTYSLDTELFADKCREILSTVRGKK